jgi:hypothetical protein
MGIRTCRWLRQLCFYFISFTHNLRCGLEEYRQLRWLVVFQKSCGSERQQLEATSSLSGQLPIAIC